MTVNEIITILLNNYTAEEVVDLCELDTAELIPYIVDHIEENQEEISEKLKEECYAPDED